MIMSVGNVHPADAPDGVLLLADHLLESGVAVEGEGEGGPEEGR